MTVTDREIVSQPAAWSRALGRADELAGLIRAPGERILVTGCGTSAFVASSVAALREAAGLGETDWAYAGEVSAVRRYDRVVALTRSGTTTEVARALEVVPAGRRVVVTAVPDAPVATRADQVLVLDADEDSVVQTRFPTSCLVAARAALGADVAHLPGQCQAVLAQPLPVDVADLDHLVYLGSGWTLGLAHEAALKVREAAQAWAESYPALDYRHGPISVAGPRSLVWLFGGADGLADTDLVPDVEATGARVLHAEGLPRAAGRVIDPLVELVQAQRIATALAAHRGLDPDRPRHLSRSVILNAVPNGASR
jgi:glutamine---fructose-6-phosphate transaminase (isomerizing)